MDSNLIYLLIGVAIVVGLLVGYFIWRGLRSRRNKPTVSLPVRPDTAGSEAVGPEATSPDLPAPAVEAESAPEPASAEVEPVVTQSVPPEAAAEIDVPEPSATRMGRLRARLSRSGALGKSLLSVLSRAELAASDWEDLEATLLGADLGLDATEELLEGLKTELKVVGKADPETAKRILREKLLELVDPGLDRSLAVEKNGDLPATVLMVGVNGTGKTTTVGKLARLLVADGKTVLLGAADTFRAAAGEQLQTWGERVGVDVIRSEKEGGDPASVAFDTVKAAIERGVDVALVDTAGRLQNKAGLMDELGKIKRVMEKQAPVSETLLVLDATTGQNGMRQAQVFAEVAEITGIVLTKLDGSAKGGIVVSVQRELGVPVKLVGLGEGADDLAPFDAEAFVDAIVEG